MSWPVIHVCKQGMSQVNQTLNNFQGEERQSCKPLVLVSLYHLVLFPQLYNSSGLSSEASKVLYTKILQGLELHGQHDAIQSALIIKGLHHYEVLVSLLHQWGNLMCNISVFVCTILHLMYIICHNALSLAEVVYTEMLIFL